MSTASTTTEPTKPACISPSERRPASRLAALDGLRGVACLVVLAHHALLTVPVFAAASSDPVASRARATPLELALTWSPLHLLWEGTGAVWVFFVLSGYVLVRQVREPASFDWLAYYPQRLARLYLPVFGAVALAALLIALFGEADHGAAASAWMQRRTEDVTVRGVVADSTLLGGAGFTVSPLWSLQWEVWFSLLLPLFVLAVRPRQAARRPLWIGLTMPLAVLAIVGLGGLEYLAVFLVGAVLAAAHESIERLVARITCRRSATAILWTGCALWVVIMLPARWTLSGISVVPAWTHQLLSVSAAAVVVVMALHCRTAVRLLTVRVLLWCGAISFSLYLVHEPIVVALVRVLGEDRLWIALPVGVVVALGVAAVFQRAVEQPAATLSRWIGRTIKDRRILSAPAAPSEVGTAR